jgi:hypothetical protein
VLWRTDIGLENDEMARHLEILQSCVCKKRALSNLLQVVGYRTVNSFQFGDCELFSVCFLIPEDKKKRKEKKRSGADACHRPSTSLASTHAPIGLFQRLFQRGIGTRTYAKGRERGRQTRTEASPTERVQIVFSILSSVGV